MTDAKQPEALRLADKYEIEGFLQDHRFAQEHWCRQAATELRRLHARTAELEDVADMAIKHIAELEAQLSAIGAGGVEPLRKRAATPAAVDMGMPISASATVSDEQIKAVFLANGFTIKEGLADLKPYVYQAARALLATGGQAQAGTYAEARECVHCNHVGINDSAEGVATCVACQWIGDSPKEDKCPDCEAEGTMTASCPKCHDEYRLIADATLADPHPTQQGLEQFIEQVGDVHFQRCRVGSKEGAIRWDIEFGHYGDEVRGKTLRDAITKALAAQAKQGGTQK